MVHNFVTIIFKTCFNANQRSMLQERRMGSIYLETDTFKRKLRRRYTTSFYFQDQVHPSNNFLKKKLYLPVFTLQAMAEKVERMELDMDSRDKVVD